MHLKKKRKKNHVIQVKAVVNKQTLTKKQKKIYKNSTWPTLLHLSKVSVQGFVDPGQNVIATELVIRVIRVQTNICSHLMLS